MCHVYAYLVWDMPSSPSRYAGLWFVLWWGLSCCSVSVCALCEMLGLPCVLFFFVCLGSGAW